MMHKSWEESARTTKPKGILIGEGDYPDISHAVVAYHCASSHGDYYGGLYGV